MSATSGRPDVQAAGTDGIEIHERSPAHPDAARLLAAFHAEQIARYGFADPVDLHPGEYTSPNGMFAIVCQGALAVGCGGWRWFDRSSQTAEIKKVYVIPAARRTGAGRALLSWLEQHAAAAGARLAILETGVRNTAALHLFTAAGYQPIDRYVPGRDPQINRAFARDLSTAGA